MSKIKLKYELDLVGRTVYLTFGKVSGFERCCGQIALYSDLVMEIRSACGPELTLNTIYLPGENKEYDDLTASRSFQTDTDAEDYYKRVKKALERVIGRGQWVCKPRYGKLTGGCITTNKEGAGYEKSSSNRQL